MSFTRASQLALPSGVLRSMPNGRWARFSQSLLVMAGLLRLTSLKKQRSQVLGFKIPLMRIHQRGNSLRVEKNVKKWVMSLVQLLYTYRRQSSRICMAPTLVQFLFQLATFSGTLQPHRAIAHFSQRCILRFLQTNQQGWKPSLWMCSNMISLRIQASAQTSRSQGEVPYCRWVSAIQRCCRRINGRYTWKATFPTKVLKKLFILSGELGTHVQVKLAIGVPLGWLLNEPGPTGNLVHDPLIGYFLDPHIKYISYQQQYLYMYRLCSTLIKQMKQSFCMTSVISTEAISASPVNTSTAKNTWTFAKSPRCNKFYDLPSMRMTRMSGMGIGERLKQRENFAPPSTRYNIQSFIDTNKNHRVGKSFGLNREETKPLGHVELGPLANPGAGTYSPQTKSGSPRWSLAKKITDKISDPPLHNQNPSPDRYNPPPAISKNGNQYWTKYNSTKSPLFAKGDRFFDFQDRNPLSWKYSPRNDLPADGRYVMSKTVGAGRRAFSVGKRSVDQIGPQRHDTPGPGAYQMPSQFGVYHQKPRLSQSQS